MVVSWWIVAFCVVWVLVLIMPASTFPLQFPPTTMHLMHIGLNALGARHTLSLFALYNYLSAQINFHCVSVLSRTFGVM